MNLYRYTVGHSTVMISADNGAKWMVQVDGLVLMSQRWLGSERRTLTAGNASALDDIIT